MKNPQTAAVISFSAASFPPIKRHSEEKQSAGEEMLQQFPSRKLCLPLTRKVRERPNSREEQDRRLTHH